MLRSNRAADNKKAELVRRAPPIQILDAIAFEKKYEEGDAELVEFSSNTKSAELEKPIPPEDESSILDDDENPIPPEAEADEENLTFPEEEKQIPPPIPGQLTNKKLSISLKEKLYILTSSVIPSIGFGLGNTVGVLLKFTAPIAGVGGAGLSISLGVMIGLTSGFGLLAVGLTFMMYHSSIKDAMKKLTTFHNDIDDFNKRIKKRAIDLNKDFQNSFAMLLELKLALEKLRRSRIALDPESSFPSWQETVLQKRINNYINFLAQDPEHPNFQKIQDETLRKEEIKGARDRQTLIKQYLAQASTSILNKNPPVEEYHTQAANYVTIYRRKLRKCFPSLHLVAPKIKRPPFININLKEFFTAFFSAFGGIFGLPFLTITLIGAFTVIPMAFPPLYPILAMGIAYGLYNVYRVNDTKKLDAERNTVKLNTQKHLSYYFDSHKLLYKRHAEESQYLIKYLPTVVAKQFSPRPQTSPSFKKHPTKELFSKAVDYSTSSDKKLTVSLSVSEESISFDDDQDQLSRIKSEETKEVKATTPLSTLSMFSSPDFPSSSNQDLPQLTRVASSEDITFDDLNQLKEKRASERSKEEDSSVEKTSCAILAAAF